MNKYGTNVGAAYVETSTLLEPNNFIPSWEAGDEEKKEVSSALRNLREQYDNTHREVVIMKNKLDILDVSDYFIKKREPLQTARFEPACQAKI